MKVGRAVRPGRRIEKKGKESTGQDRTVQDSLKKSQSGNISPIWGEAPTVPMENQDFHRASSRRRNLVCKVSGWNFQGLQFYGGSNFPFSYIIFAWALPDLHITFRITSYLGFRLSYHFVDLSRSKLNAIKLSVWFCPSREFWQLPMVVHIDWVKIRIKEFGFVRFVAKKMTLSDQTALDRVIDDLAGCHRPISRGVILSELVLRGAGTELTKLPMTLFWGFRYGVPFRKQTPLKAILHLFTHL